MLRCLWEGSSCCCHSLRSTVDLGIRPRWGWGRFVMDDTDIDELDMLSISYLNALEYCPRRFYYECALSEFLDNAHVVEGTMRSEKR